MKRIKTSVVELIPQLCIALAALLVLVSLFNSPYDKNIDKVAARLSERVEKRLALMEKYTTQALQTPTNDFLLFEDLPEDMVIYRYINDSLRSWSNQFPLVNDDISSKLMIERLTNIRSNIISPLAELTENESFVSMGTKWYIIKKTYGAPGETVISGLEIKNSLARSHLNESNGTNPELKLASQISITDISESGGYPVYVHGRPLFKLLYEPESLTHFHSTSILRWIAMFLMVFGIILNLLSHKTIKRYILALATIVAVMATTYIWGLQLNGVSSIFSPSTYADGPFLFSLGALIIVNAFVAIITICNYIMLDVWTGMIDRKGDRLKLRYGALGGCTIISATIVFIYLHKALKSLILNSNISLNFFSVVNNIGHSVIVYLSFILLIISLLLHLQALKPVIRVVFGVNFSVLGKKGILTAAALASLYFTSMIYMFGFEKEENKVRVWANRLSVDRDLALEISLSSMEDGIASDEIISALAQLDNTNALILNRISEFYFGRTAQTYNLNLRKFDDNSNLRVLNNILRTGQAITDGSHFMFVSDDSGHSRYIGIFQYYNENTGLSRLLLTIEPNSNMEDRGYYGLMGHNTNLTEVRIPEFYSYAKYINDKLVSYKGVYPYPMVHRWLSEPGASGRSHDVQRRKGYIHFVHYVSNNEVIVISRNGNQTVMFFTSFAFLFLTLTLILFVIAHARRRRSPFRNQYFKHSLNSILMLFSVIILLSMASISIWFVYNRNRTNLNNMMSDKINTVQAMLENRLRWAHSWDDVNFQDFAGQLELIGNTTKSDITIYSADGRVIQSTTPEIFARMILGCRMNQDAFYNIRYLSQRYFINKENFDDKSIYFLYAPIMNDENVLMGFVCTPYTDRDFNYTREAYVHGSLVLCIFLILLILALIFSSNVVDRIFDPIIRIGEKMSRTDVHNLEYISYGRKDEISTLVEAYNRMVGDLKESTMKLTQAERDKAWSEMARQVAHEIKNPLTPIKLEIQRLIRMKAKGNPAWTERFDRVASVVLEQIEILADTANEFSTFAKLYSEEPVEIDLDKLLKDQIILFDNRPNIELMYIGQADSLAMAPKPQLTRVFINLISNAIQAVEIKQEDLHEKGEDYAGKIAVCLRNSLEDGYYDIVIDDNGYGVKPENQDKLFTPNFTTKSSGTGLGLAISRNIMEKCGGSISYQKSFSLGGASFIVRIPKKQ